MKKKIITVVEWNLNFAGQDSSVPPFVAKYIEGNDVVVLTEVKANENLVNMIEALGYDFIVSDDQGKNSNQIIIMAKKEYRLKAIRTIVDIDEKLAPDFLHGAIDIGKKKVNIIGVRVKTSGYADRFVQVKKMMAYLSTVEGSIICVGDFNSGQIRGLEDSNYADVAALYKYRNRSEELSELRHYNFHLIRNLIGSRFILKETMGEDNSWGLSEKEGGIAYGLGKRVKNDQIFYSSDIEGISSYYSWSHVRDNEKEYLKMLRKNYKRPGNKINHGYPDHARLTAKLVV